MRKAGSGTSAPSRNQPEGTGDGVLQTRSAPRPGDHSLTSLASRTGTGTAHGKVILIGEHSVVHGAPAIAAPLPGVSLTATVTAGGGGHVDSDLYTGALAASPGFFAPVRSALAGAAELTGFDASDADLLIRGDVPVGRGLGSSAAVATAVVRSVAAATGVTPDQLQLQRLVQQAESIAHGRSSGLDPYAVAATGPILFDGGRPRRVSLVRQMTLVIADSGRPGSTAEAVGGVQARLDADPAPTRAAIAELASLTETVRRGLCGEAEWGLIGEAFTRAHSVLAGLGVSGDLLDTLVEAALQAGATGAKLTGGGLGGCVIALVPSATVANRVGNALLAAGAERVWTSTLPAAAAAHRSQEEAS